MLNKFNTIKKKEIIWLIFQYTLYALIAIYFYIILYKFNINRFNSQYTDSAGYVDLVESLRLGYGFLSPIFSSFFSYIPYLTFEPQKFCNEDFVSVYKETSYLTWHPYLIAYPMAVISEIFKIGSIEISSAINSINIIGTIALIFGYLRSKNFGILSSSLYCIGLLTSGIWIGMIYGQLYFDRLMLFPATLMVLSLAGSWFYGKKRLVLILISYFLCLLISERTTLIALLVLFGYVILSASNENFKNKIIFITLSVIGLFYLYMYKNLYQNNLYYDAISIGSMVTNFKDAFTLESRMAQLTFKWLIALAPLIALSIFSKRYFIIVLGALLPNLLISIGGAEKTGFWTHYHAVYFPILIGFSTIAIAKIGTIQTKLVPIAISLLMIIYNLFINIDDDSKVFKTNSIEEARGVLNRYIELHPNSDLNKSLTINGNYFFDFAKSIPKDITVSSPEILMPALVKNGNRLVDYFPIGLGINEYLIAQVDSKSGMYIVPTFLDNNSGQSIQKCVTEIINQKYVKMEHINKDFNQSIEILKLRNKNN